MINKTNKSSKTKSDQWLTPPEIIKELGPFDLDPCSPIDRPWDTAKEHYNINDDGLIKKWSGRVWLNPPKKNIGLWLYKFNEHGRGIALIPASTDTKMFHDQVWDKADSLLFIKGRLRFCHIDGSRSKDNGGSGSVLMSNSPSDTAILMTRKGEFIKGKLVRL